MSGAPVVRRLPPLPSTRDILRMYNLRAKKSLSQNFLLDPKCLDRLARAAGPLQGKTVVEVGPGPGGITRALIGNGAREVHVVEKDPRFLPSLRLLQEASGNTLHINLGDCLKYNMSKLFPDELRESWSSMEPSQLLLIGNLPFNVATPFLIRLMRAMSSGENLFTYGRVPSILTFQHEVAYRMVAAPQDLQRCRLSILVQNYATVNYKYTLQGGAFTPPPKVDVGVVTLRPLEKPYIDVPFPFLESFLRVLFTGKRKTIQRTLKRLYPLNCNYRKHLDDLFALSGVDRGRRAIELDMNEVQKLVYAYQAQCQDNRHIARYFIEVAKDDEEAAALVGEESDFLGIKENQFSQSDFLQK